MQEEEKDKKLAFHYYQGTLNHKKELETMEWNKFQSTREEVIKATKKLNDKQKAELKREVMMSDFFIYAVLIFIVLYVAVVLFFI